MIIGFLIGVLWMIGMLCIIAMCRAAKRGDRQ